MTKLSNYFKQKKKKVEEQKEEKVFNLVLVDIWETDKNANLVCVKKNMYDSYLKYITISYRWGEIEEQLVETPDYIAHITSFDIIDLVNLCKYTKCEPDLKRNTVFMDRYYFSRST
ncbi:unnamed protein product [Cunninghamella blakesleeana]